MTETLRILVWQWGRRGAGPRFAVELAAGLNQVPSVAATLSLSLQSEQIGMTPRPQVDLAYRTYTGLGGFLARVVTAPLRLPALIREVRALRPDLAICAMPAPLDLLMGAALRRLKIPFWVVVHDADSHPGDGFPFQMTLQRYLTDRAQGLVALSGHVAQRLREQGHLGARTLILISHPPFAFGPKPPPPRSHGGKLRLLFFGRLLPYKGLDLFADALRRLGPRDDLDIRVAGLGPESAALADLRTMPNVVVDHRWIPEDEVGALLAWSDALVLSHREASQSGVAAAAIAAGRWLVATRVGGLAEQLGQEKLARLCDPTPDSLAAAIMSLIDAPPEDSAVSPTNTWPAVAASLVRQIQNLEQPTR